MIKLLLQRSIKRHLYGTITIFEEVAEDKALQKPFQAIMVCFLLEVIAHQWSITIVVALATWIEIVTNSAMLTQVTPLCQILRLPLLQTQQKN